MSRLFEALQQSGLPIGAASESESPLPSDVLAASTAAGGDLDSVRCLPCSLPPHQRVPALNQPQGVAAEQFRILSTRLHRARESRELKTVLVTSSAFQEGKSFVSLNLAVTLAKRAHSRVLLVEFDLRKPGQCPMLGLSGLTGLGDWHKTEEPITHFLYQVAGLNLWLLPAGTPIAQPLELLQSPRLPQVLGQLAGSFDWVIIDSPPLLPMADSSILCRLVEGVLLVARQGWTSRKFLQKAMESMEPERFLGVVVNNASGLARHHYERYYAESPRRNGDGRSRKTAGVPPPSPSQDQPTSGAHST